MNAPGRESYEPHPAIGHMPFKGHRTVAEVWEEEARRCIRRGLGRNGHRKEATP